MKNIQVLLVTSHQDTRKRCAEILHDANDIRLVVETGSGREILEKLNSPLPDVVVMDLTPSSMAGEQMTRHLHETFPDIKILALSQAADENSFSGILAAGARGYLVMPSATEELAPAIRSVHRGGPYFCVNSREILMKRFLVGLNSSR